MQLVNNVRILILYLIIIAYNIQIVKMFLMMNVHNVIQIICFFLEIVISQFLNVLTNFKMIAINAKIITFFNLIIVMYSFHIAESMIKLPNNVFIACLIIF